MPPNKKKMPRKKNSNIKLYKIDDVVYKSKTLFDFHIECKEMLSKKLIETFEVPKALSKKSRYTTYKPLINDIKFDSLMEARYYLKLLKDKKNGIIKSFEMQKTYPLQPKFKKNGKIFQAIDYVSDFFVIVNDEVKYVVDIKGKETVEFRIKHKMFEYKYPELELKVIQYYEPTDKWLELSEIRKLNRKSKSKKTK